MVDHEERLDEIIAGFLRAAEAGQPLSQSELLRANPDLAEDLADFFQEYNHFDHVTEPLRSLVHGPQPELPEALENYEILAEIGRGGMGVIYKARQKRPSRLVALKMILTGQRASPTDRQRFRAESEAAACLEHPHIVPIYEVGEHVGQPFYSMKLIESGNLSQRLGEFCLLPLNQVSHDTKKPGDRDTRKDGDTGPGVPIPSSLGRVSATRVAQLMATVADAVHYAHQRGILHRDLKPANILLDPGGVPYVSDFGLAKRLIPTEGGPAPTQTGAILGTPSYMPPEQARGQKEAITIASDVYSLGAILYELLTGRPPFRADSPMETMCLLLEREPESPRTLNPRVPADLETICLRCLEKEPGRRYASAQALADDLRRFSAGEPIAARPIGNAERCWRWCRRNPGTAALIGSFAATVVAGFALVFSQYLEADKQRKKAVALVGQVQAENQRAETNLKKAEESTEVAEANFRQLRQAVKDLWLNVSEKELFNKPGSIPLRRDLLRLVRGHYEDFLKQRGDDIEIRTELASLHFRIGQLESALGAKKDALEDYFRARDTFDKLVQDRPNDPSLRRQLAVSYINAAAVVDGMGRRDEARTALNTALEHLRKLVKDFPPSAENMLELAAALENQAVMLHNERKADEALKTYDEAAAAFAKAVELDPKNELIQTRLVRNERDRADHLVSIGRPEEALEVYRKACQRLDPWTKGKTFRGETFSTLASCNRALADQLIKMNRFDEAREPLDRAIYLWKNVVDADPYLVKEQYQLAMAYRMRATEKIRSRKLVDKAIDDFHQTRKLLERHLEQNSKNSAARQQLGDVYFHIGVDHSRKNRPAEAAAVYQQARAVQETLHRDYPNDCNLRTDLNGTLNNLSELLANEGKVAEAIAMITQAIQIEQVAVERFPRSAKYRAYLGSNYGMLGQFRRKTGEFAEAEAAAEERARVCQALPSELVRAARDFAQLANAAGEDQKLRTRAANRSVQTLQQAIERGFRDAELLKQDSNFDSLRSRADFQELLRKIS
jgi:serine/threonine-protein kinase